MNFKGFVETSFVDWDGNVSSVVFTPGCNFRCPFCFNKDLVLDPDSIEDIPEEFIIEYIEKHRDFIDGLCITGGEPTMMTELPDFCKRLKEKGFGVKLDTNGANTEVLKSLIDQKLVDYIAMDLKGPWDKYSEFAGVAIDVEKIKESVQIIMNSGIGYEFRTTIIPGMHTKEVFEKTVLQVKSAKKYCIQKFRPANCIDPAFNNIKAQSQEEFEEFAGIARKHVEVVKVRGK